MHLSVKIKPEQVSLFFLGDVLRGHRLAWDRCQRSISGPVVITRLLVKRSPSGLLSKEWTEGMQMIQYVLTEHESLESVLRQNAKKTSLITDHKRAKIELIFHPRSAFYGAF